MAKGVLIKCDSGGGGMKKLVAVLLCLGLFGCEKSNYQIMKDEKGAVYRLNKKTGEITLIKNDEIIVLKDRDQVLIKNKEIEDSLNKPLEWGPFKISGKSISVKITASWRDGKIYVKTEISPPESMSKYFERIKYLAVEQTTLKDEYNRADVDAMTKINSDLEAVNAESADLSTDSIILLCVDKNGMEYKRFIVPLLNTTQIFDDNGVAIMREYQIIDNFSRSDYESLKEFAIAWNLHDEYYATQ